MRPPGPVPGMFEALARGIGAAESFPTIDPAVPVFKGESVANGVALGHVWLEGFEDEESYPRRIASDQVENELNRLREAIETSRAQIDALKTKHGEELEAKELRIFDVHLEYLQDPMFIDEIENLVMKERYSVRAAIRQVVEDYDRIFALVENDYLRQRAGDFRDVATRLLRNLASANGTAPDIVARPEGNYILAARKLTVNELFKIDHERVAGIVAEEGGISSHAAILARSMGIPTITGIRDLAAKLQNRDFVIIDAAAGQLHVEPDERLRAEYERSASQIGAGSKRSEDERPHQTRDGAKIRLLASCGSASEVELARTYGMDGIGLYRTELMFLIDKREPSEDVLAHHYEEIASGQPADQLVAFRLLDVAAGSGIVSMPQHAEKNPALGLRGIRALLADGAVLRLQLRAILRATAKSPMAAVLVPFVTGISELQRVKAAIVEERLELRKRKVPCADQIKVAPIIEVPAAAFMLGALLNESSFVVVAVDDLQALLLASDRDNRRVREYYTTQHPAFFELVARMAREARAHKKDMVLFGEGAADAARLPFYIGVGIRSFSIAPVGLDSVLETCRKYTVDECRQIADRVLEAPRALDVQRLLLRYARS